MYSVPCGRIAVTCAFLVAVLQGCGTVPDVPHHAVCVGADSCADAVLRDAVKVRDDVRIDPLGWSACLTGDMQKLEGDADVVRDARCSDRKKAGNEKAAYSEAWLEYKATGESHNAPWQREAVLRWIRAQSGPLYVAVYVHGWHHNADTSNNDPRNNAIKFALMMARQVDALRRLEATNGLRMLQVLGIYVGWQGESYDDLFRKVISIDSRSKTADRIGRKGVLKTDLMAITDAMRAQGGSESRMVVFGHSFGGRMLTSTFASDLDRGEPQPLGADTTIVTLNAAVGADCYDGLLGKAGKNPERERPTWINITSEDDTATKLLYPFASGIKRVDGCHPDSAANSATVGHYRPYLNQVLDQVGCNDCDKGGGDPQARARALASEPRWFRRPDRLFLAFPQRVHGVPDPQATRVRSINFAVEDGRSMQVLGQGLWNVRSDESIFDFSVGGGGVGGRHNGYVNTIRMRLLTEVQYPGLGTP